MRLSGPIQLVYSMRCSDGLLLVYSSTKATNFKSPFDELPVWLTDVFLYVILFWGSKTGSFTSFFANDAENDVETQGSDVMTP